jgi:DNA invertase Pin-like site-specific DNA recombinase
MKYGYIRVSSLSQDYFRQQLPMKECGVLEENIFEEKVSGTKRAITRPAFEEMLEKLQPNDECIFESMSRMARSMQDLIDTTNRLVKQYKVKVVFLKENIVVGGNDKDNAMTSLIFNIMGSFAQFERDLISDRTKQGIRARRELKPDFKIGRQKTTDTALETEVRECYANRKSLGLTSAEICEKFGLTNRVFYRIIKESENERDICR